MAITRYNTKTEIPDAEIDTLILVLTNGDKVALEEAINRWGFLNAESFLKFVLAVMLKAEGNKITIQVDGNQTGITPSDNLLKRGG